MTDPDLLISPAQALAHVAPDFLRNLSDADYISLVASLDIWLRPDQIVPRGAWRSYGIIGGRGYGKTLAIAHEINRRVEAGEARSIGLIAPTEDRVRDVQQKALIELSPPWFHAEAYGFGVRWPNGVVAECHSAQSPNSTRSSNFDLSWLCEIIAWQATARKDAFANITTATRLGRAQFFYDTTSKGKNEVIQALQKAHAQNPDEHLLVRGTIFDNPLLSRQYLRGEVAKYLWGSQRCREELLGEIFAESAGALWKQDWLDAHRGPPPIGPEIILVSLDPSMSDGSEADEAGGCVLARGRDQRIAVLADLSGRQKPETWAAAAVDWCERGASGVLYERNHCGDMPRDMIKLIAAQRKLAVEIITDDKRPFPPRKAGTIYVRSIMSRNEKGERAEAPAKMFSDGSAFMAGTHEALELEMTTWEQGMASPNRLDACVQGVAELAGLRVPKSKPRDEHAASNAAALQKRLTQALTGRSRSIGL
jgi:phage terminase large subunit-like protein